MPHDPSAPYQHQGPGSLPPKFATHVRRQNHRPIQEAKGEEVHGQFQGIVCDAWKQVYCCVTVICDGRAPQLAEHAVPEANNS